MLYMLRPSSASIRAASQCLHFSYSHTDSAKTTLRGTKHATDALLGCVWHRHVLQLMPVHAHVCHASDLELQH